MTNILEICTNDHLILKAVSDEIVDNLWFDNPKLSKELKDLIRDMKDTMLTSGGCGLAANQVNKPYRLFVWSHRNSDGRDTIRYMINPMIISSGGRCKNYEGCLSYPNRPLKKIKRKSHMVVKWVDINNKSHEEVFTGFNAFTIQHEIDHLNGVTLW